MKRPPIARLPFLFVLGLSGAAIASACAPGSDLPSDVSSGAGLAGGQGGSGGEPVLTVGAGPDSDAGPDPDAACGLVTEEADATPLNLYIVFDKSSSMAGNKWDSAKAGLAAFVNDPSAAGVRVALNFFPKAGPATCDQFAYKEPLVPFGELPMNATAITDAMNAAAPNGTSTPIYPALGGAILKGIEVAQNTPGDASAVLLVTDGLPQGPAAMCGGVNPEDPDAIANLAATGANYTPPVPTFVIGLPGVDQSFANKVAASGGTDAAILVSAANVQAEFQAALAKVRGKALPCEFFIPEKVEGGDVDPGLVNVLFTPGGAMPVVLPQDADCSGEGWRYDDPVKPTKIIFGPASCQDVKSDYKAKVQILLGCETEVAK